MSEKPKRQAAFLLPCPECGAQTGFACVGKRGPRLAPHQARLKGISNRVVAKIKAAQANVRKGEVGSFYRSEAWRLVRYRVLIAHGGACGCCGARASLGKPLHVDHIKPRSRYPELELEISNLQVLCDDCNLGKGATDQTDWRPSRKGLQ